MDEAQLRRAAGAYRLSQAIYAAASLGVADHIGSEPRTAAELAAATASNARGLRRLMRALASEGIFEELADGRFAHNEASRALASSSGLRDMILGWTVLPAGYQAFSGLAEAVRGGESAFFLTHGASFHDYLEREPEVAAAYNRAMDSTVASFDEAAAQYDFGRFESIVDVGGGGGAFMVAVLRRHPGTRAISLDLPAVIDQVRSSGVPADLEGRLELRGADFFHDPLPAADGYVLSTVLRLFDDDGAVRLLSAIRRSMKTTSRLVVMDFVHPDGPLPSPLGLADLQAMVLYGGQDRSRGEFEELMRQAGLRVGDFLPGDGLHAVFDATPI